MSDVLDYTYKGNVNAYADVASRSRGLHAAVLELLRRAGEDVVVPDVHVLRRVGEHQESHRAHPRG